MMPRWAYFLTAIMFAINLLFIGLGLVDVNSSPLASDSMSTLNQSINEYDTSEQLNTGVTVDSSSNVSEGSDNTVKFGLSEIVNLAKTFFNLVLALLFGYSAIFWMLSMPPILVYLFSTIIGLSMIMVLLDILIQVVSAIRSLRII